jgi:hypothetical protein
VTISQESVIESVQQKLLSEGFLAYEKIRLGKRLDSGLTLHEVIRRSVGMKDGDSTYMYWEWRELKPSLDAMWTALDEAASRVEGRRTTAIAFCSPDSRSRDEVLRMLESVHVIETNSIPSVTRRPTKSEAQVRFTGKLLGAILMAMGTLELTRDSGFGVK